MRYIISAWIVLSILLSAASVWAQDRVAIIDVTPRSKDSKRSVPVMRSALDKNARIKVVKVKGLGEQLKSTYKLSTKTLSKGKLRLKYQERIRRAVRGLDLDALIVMEALGRGKKLQIVILGRDGKQVENIIEPLRRKRLNSGIAKTLAIDIEGLIEPASSEEEPVKPEEKEEQPKPSSVAVAPETDEAADAPEDLDDLDEEASDDALDYVLNDTLSVGVGAFFGRRSLRSLTPASGPGELPNELTHDAPYFGPALALEAATTFADHSVQLGASLDAGWAPFDTQFADSAGVTFGLASSMIRATFDASLHYAPADIFALGPYAGVDYMSVSIAENDTYEGHTYTNVRAGLSVLARPMEQLSLNLCGGYIPLLNYSYIVGTEDAQGDVTRTTVEGSTTGLEAKAGLKLHVSESFNIKLGYHYVTVADSEDDVAETTDTIHQGNASLNYAF